MVSPQCNRPKYTGSRHWSRLRRSVGCKEAGKQPMLDHFDRSAQLPPVLTVAVHKKGCFPTQNPELS